MYLGLERPVKDKKQIRRAKNLPDQRLFLWSYICHGSSFLECFSFDLMVFMAFCLSGCLSFRGFNFHLKFFFMSSVMKELTSFIIF